MLLSRQRSHGRNAESHSRGCVLHGVVVVTGWHREGVALRMNGPRGVAGSAAGNRLSETLVNGRHGQVVIQELGELHRHQGVTVVQI